MRILFLDQSGQIGGAELSLADIAEAHRETCLVGLFADGPFRHLLEQRKIPVEVLATQAIRVRKDSSMIHSLSSAASIIPIIAKVIKTSHHYDIIYANTQKALVIGAVASWLCHRPLVYHLRDILSAEHFSQTNRYLAVTLANHCASLVIANSKATQAAFVKAGGRSDITTVVYNGFDPKIFDIQKSHVNQIRQQLGLEGKFVVGHFSRLSPWKGQHILLDALTRCPQNVAAIFVGDALFGEQSYVERLHQQVADLGLEKRVHFLGFRSDTVPLMAACDLVSHTSTFPEPFGRVIVEAMLCRRPVVAAASGGVLELVEQGKTGWLVTPGDADELARTIIACQQTESIAMLTDEVWRQTSQRFHLSATNQQIAQLLNKLPIQDK